MPAYCANIDLTVCSLKFPTDTINDRMLVSVHSYDPYDYTIGGKYNEWGHIGTNNLSTGNEQYIKSLATKLKTNYLDKGRGVYVGEYGCPIHKGYEKYRLYYMEYFTYTFVSLGIPLLYWDNNAYTSGEMFGLFKRPDGTIYDSDAQNVVDVIMRAAGVTAQPEGYNADYIYNSVAK